MSELSSSQLIDILLPEVVQPDSAMSMVAGLLGVVGILAIYATVRYYQQPLRVLRRRLIGHRLSPREVAHQLSHVSHLTLAQMVKIERIRFSCTEPTVQQLLDFIKNIRSQ